MSLNNLGLSFAFTASDMASGVMDNIKKNFKMLGEAAGQSTTTIDGMVKKLGGGLTAAAVGAGGLAGSFMLAKKAGGFEAALSEIRKVTQATEPDMLLMKTAAQDLAKQMGLKPTELTGAMYELATQGYKTKDMLKLLPQVMNFAAAGNLNAADATGILNQALKGFGINTLLAGDAMDQMQTAANEMSMDTKDLTVAFGRVSAGVSSVGGTLTDALTWFGLAKNAMGSVELAATSTGIAFQRLSDDKVRKLLREKLHLEVVDKDGNFKGVMNSLVEIGQRLHMVGGQAQQNSLLMEAFGHDGGKAMVTVLKQLRTGIEGSDGIKRYGLEAARYMHDLVAEADGTTKVAAEIMRDNFSHALDRMTATWDIMTDRLGEPFIKVWRPVVEAVTRGLDRIDTWVQGLSETTKDNAAMFVILGSVAMLAAGSLSVIAKMGPLISTVLTWIGSSGFAAEAGLVAAEASVWPFVAAAAAAGGAVYMVENNVGGLGDTWDSFSDTMTGSSGVLGAVWEYLQDLWNTFVAAFKGSLDDVSPVLDMLGGAFSELGKTIGGIFNIFTSGVGKHAKASGFLINLVRLLGSAFAWVGGIVGFALTLMVTLANVLLKVFSIVFIVVEKFLEYTLGQIGLILGFIADMFGMAKTPIKFETGFEKPSEIVNASFKQDDKAAPTSLPDAAQTASTVAQQMNGGPPVGSDASAEERHRFSGMRDKSTRMEIDYDELAAALAKQPVVVNIDGEKLAIAVQRGLEKIGDRGARPTRGL